MLFSSTSVLLKAQSVLRGTLLCALLTGLSISFVCMQRLSAQDSDDKTKKAKTEKPGAKERSGETKRAPSPSLNTPIPINISRRTLSNFLTDSKALAPYLTSDKTPRPFRSAFVIDSPQSDFAVVWDQQSCRIVGVVNLKPVPVPVPNKEKDDDKKKDPKKGGEEKDESDTKEDKNKVPSPYVFIAAGSSPLSASVSAVVQPKYFGFRIVEKRPEFLYSLGKLAVEESIWLDAGGKELKQRFRIQNLEADATTKLSFPEDWRKRIENESGKWKGDILTIPKENAGEFVLTYRLNEKE